jgi:hypothetical protein
MMRRDLHRKTRISEYRDDSRFKTSDNSDSAVALGSQLDLRARRAASRICGFGVSRTNHNDVQLRRRKSTVSFAEKRIRPGREHLAATEGSYVSINYLARPRPFFILRQDILLSRGEIFRRPSVSCETLINIVFTFKAQISILCAGER